jgi:hypothetical protein
MKPHLWLYASVPLLLAAQASHAANYYVATTGNDTNAGTEAAPFKTIQKAANIVNAGDTVYIGFIPTKVPKVPQETLH